LCDSFFRAEVVVLFSIAFQINSIHGVRIALLVVTFELDSLLVRANPVHHRHEPFNRDHLLGQRLTVVQDVLARQLDSLDLQVGQIGEQVFQVKRLVLQVLQDQQVVFDVLQDLHLLQDVCLHSFTVDEVLLEFGCDLTACEACLVAIKCCGVVWISRLLLHLRSSKEHLVHLLQELDQLFFDSRIFWLKQELAEVERRHKECQKPLILANLEHQIKLSDHALDALEQLRVLVLHVTGQLAIELFHGRVSLEFGLLVEHLGTQRVESGLGVEFAQLEVDEPSRIVLQAFTRLLHKLQQLGDPEYPQPRRHLVDVGLYKLCQDHVLRHNLVLSLQQLENEWDY